MGNNENNDMSIIRSPVQCYKLNIMALFAFIAFIFCIFLNFILALSLASKKELRSTFNTILFSLAIVNLIGSSFGFPIVIISNLECGWIFHEIGCQITAFIMTFTGISSVYLLTFMSFERYHALKIPNQIRQNKSKRAKPLILIAFSLSLFWSLMPLIGWSRYSLEGALTSCSPEWRDHSFNVISFNISIITCVLGIPFTVLIVSNIMLIRILARLRFPIALCSQVNFRRRINFERNVTISSICLVASFMISWFPYALSSMYSAFFDSNAIEPIWTTLPALLAKSSMAWSPAVYIMNRVNLAIAILNSNINPI